jgi:2'-5' RNA ligase
VIVVDTSALMAIILDEPSAVACMAAIETEDAILISSGTLTEALIVAEHRGVPEEMQRLVNGLGFEVVAVTPAAVSRIAQAYVRWGKGTNPSGLNFGDCFAYSLAKDHGCPLLYVGDDFAETDIESVLEVRSAAQQKWGPTLPQQSLFPEAEAPPPPPLGPFTDRLFFAIFPDAATADRIARTAGRLKAENGLRGRPLQTGRFHLTLHHVDDYHGLPRDVVSAICRAAETVRFAPFEVEFDRAMSFSGRSGNRPFVLRGGDGLSTLEAFQSRLVQVLIQARAGRRPGKFVPHVTLLYDNMVVQERPIEPIRWMVGEFVLVHSLLGQTQHVPLARWSLDGRGNMAK